MFSPPGGKKPPVPSNFFQFICMDHHCITCNFPHCDLLSAQTTYLIGVFGGLLERSIFYLSLCMAHISACIEANLKNYMRSGKIFSRASIWDQPGLPRSIRLEVTVERRQIWNLVQFRTSTKSDMFLCNPNNLAFHKSIFKNNMRSGKSFSRGLIWDQLRLPCSICLEVTARKRQT